MHPYTANEIQAIINEAFKQGFDHGQALQKGAPMPEPPRVHAIVDHPYTGSDTKGQYRRPWLTDPRGQRGLVRGSKTEKSPL